MEDPFAPLKHGARALVVAVVTTALLLSGVSASVAAEGSATSSASAVLASQTPKLGIPLVIGTAHVGSRVYPEHGHAPLEVYQHSDGGVPYQHAIAYYSYQWFADGKALKGKTGAELRIDRSLAGKRLSFRVTARMPGGETATAMSLETPRVSLPGVVRMVDLPIHPERGNSRYELKASGWPKGTKFRYQWVIDELPVRGATGRVFELFPRAHTYLNLHALVTVERRGYETLTLLVPSNWRAGLVDGELTNEVTPQIVSVRGEGTPRGQAVGSLEGVVQSLSGRPVAGATINVQRTGYGSTYSSPVTVKKVKTDRDGHARVTGLAPGNYCLEVQSERGFAHPFPQCLHDYVGTTVRVYAGSITPFFVAVDKTVNIVGTVTDSRKKAVRYARVNVYTLETTTAGYSRFEKVRTVTADAHGKYRLTGLARNSYVLKAGGTTALTHRSDWWRSRSADFTFDRIEPSDGGTATRNIVLQAYLPIGTPTVKGAARVGSKLTANHRKTDGARYAYSWRADGKTIRGATSASLVISRALVGKRISVVVSGSRSGYAKTMRQSEPTAKIPR